MKINLYTLALRFFCTLPFYGHAAAQSTDDSTPIRLRCADDYRYFQNRWNVTINKDDLATKESLLETNVLFSKQGFKILNVSTFAYENNLNKYQRFTIGFSNELFRTPEEAEEAKFQVLEKIETLPGNQLKCDAIVRPAPSIGVSN